MTKLSKILTSTGLALLLAACGSGADETPTPDASASAVMDMSDPNNPFADSEMAMSEAMTAAVGVDAGDTWVRKMIAHHEGALAMSKVALAQNPGEHVAGMANDIVAKQTKEIATLKKLIASGAPDSASARLYADAEMKMHDDMMAGKGADFSETFHKKMLAHHLGAVALSDIALANGAKGAVRTQIELTRADQAKEAKMVQAMLAGAPMPMATPEAAKEKTAPATPKTATSPKVATAKPAATPKPSPTSSPDPMAGHDMSKMKM